jgi:hypothetical protein
MGYQRALIQPSLLFCFQVDLPVIAVVHWSDHIHNFLHFLFHNLALLVPILMQTVAQCAVEILANFFILLVAG